MLPTNDQWQKIGLKHHHGINIPLFSLHSKNSCGIGEFTDLIPLIPWCQANGFDIIQLLPLNDTGPDQSPYSAISAFALNPIHLGLAALPFLDEFPELKSLLPKMQALKNKQRIDYVEVHKLKEEFLRQYYQKVFSRINSQPEFLQFLKENDWLKGYAVFKVLKILHNWTPWESWNLTESISQLKETHAKAMQYHLFLQYLCFHQLEKVKQIAQQHSFFLKGDIPILISRESADVWLHPDLFILNYVAGAPPDMYSKDGQNWEFPLYNWQAMESDHFKWWKQRLEVASHFYHLYRLDHVVGFYRIWAITPHGLGREGKFIPENSNDWIPQGEKILNMMIANSEMLPIAEDLGVVPPEIRQSLAHLGICGTKVMRWERRWNEDKRFIDPRDFSWLSMTTVSTHDSETLPQWWLLQEAEDYAKQKGWEYTTQLSREQQYSFLHDSHHSGSFFHINLLNEYLFLVPGMSWPNKEDERINVPGVVSDRNWTYRFRPSIDEMIQSPELARYMRELTHAI